MHPYILLAISIAAEVVATSALKSSQGLTRLWPSVLAVLGYCAAFYLVSKVMNHMATGVVYAIWSGLGVVLTGAWAAMPQDLRDKLPYGELIAPIVFGLVIFARVTRPSGD